jgi:tetratricopeptide (TPR) repeat protein
MILFMIKNESRIITRSIQSTLPFADAICIEDTGSTDDTCSIITEHFKTLPIPGKLYQHPWRNFGYSRTHSFQSAQAFCVELGWNPARTYVFAMDADMNLIVNPQFNKEALTLTGYQVTQRAGSLHYINMRLMRLSDNWKCIGATHEYWSTPDGAGPTGRVDDELMYIDDKNDGGCKADKFTRDLQLLTEELETDPTNVRTHFYLAQTYKCLGDTENAIKFYKKRITLGGWYEEVWMSHYMIAQIYLSKRMPEKAELWVQRAQKYNNYRADALYALAHYYRCLPDAQWKAMHYLREAMKIKRPDVALFLEAQVYDYLLDYEYTILQHYVNPVRIDGNMASMRYLLKEGAPYTDNVFSNLEFYTEPLPQFYKRIPLNAPEFDEFKASSPSALRLSDGNTLLNIRYVNYETHRNGTYHPRDPEGQVRTRNAYIHIDLDETQPPRLTPHSLTHMSHEPPSDLTVHPTRIHGLEDVRLFEFNEKIYYTASASEFSPNFRVVMGQYDLLTNRHINNRVLESPTDRPCEKNWLAVTHGPELKFIYNWSPFQAGVIEDGSSNRLNITITHQTPSYFRQLRGSANPVLYQDTLYVLTHSVKYGTPRKYFHHIVKLNQESLKPIEISHAFAFEEVGIEYCLSMNISDGDVEFYYSHFDSNPKYLRIPLTEFKFISI